MELPLGDGTIEVTLPDCDATVAEAPGGSPVDVRAAAESAMDGPHGPSLGDRADPDDEIAIVVTDITRDAPDDVLLDLFLEELRAAGVDRQQVTVIIGLGLHRPMTDDELHAMLGEKADLAVNHDPDAVVEVGTVDGVPIAVHPVVDDADLVLSTGVVEPHQYAGFSGGAKTVVIGAGSEEFIRYTHGPEMLSQDGVRLGRIDSNPFREAVDRAGDLAGPDFCLNLTKGPTGILDVAAGDPRAVVSDLAETAREALSVPVEMEYDAVVAGVGGPKDANLYQASRAATYVALGDRNPLRSEGRIVIPAELSEGAGQGTGEQRFYQRLSEASDAETLYEAMKEGYDPGAQRAFVVAQVLQEFGVFVTDSETPAVVGECLMHAEPTVEDAIAPESDVLVLPDALNTLLVDGDR
ncbi:MAG: nickel-dependent lactate racemase [Halobacteriales archaeon]|jgi:nickel-dependent lactate racemase